MGFLKKFFYLLILIILNSCSASLIKVNVKNTNIQHPIFGTNSQRYFFYPIILSDTLNLLWRATTYAGFNNSSVVISDSIVFVSELSGRVYAFFINSGKPAGVIKTKGTIYSSPIVLNYRIYYPLIKKGLNLTELIVYDFFSGKLLHSIEIFDRITNQILFDNNAIYLTAEDGTVYKFSFEMKLIWQLETKSNINCVPALLNDYLFIGNQSGEILKINKNDGKILNRVKISSRFLSGITATDDAIFIADEEGILFSINPRDLNIIFKTPTGAKILMNPAIDFENIFIGNLKGKFFSINKSTGKINWSKNLGGLLNVTPLVTLNKIILPDAFKAIWFLEKQSGLVTKKLELEGRAKLSPVLFNNYLIIGYDDGVLETYEFH